MKSALITFLSRVTLEDLIYFKRRLKYSKVYIFTNSIVIAPKKLEQFKKFQIVPIKTEGQIETKVNEIIAKSDGKTKFYPFFLRDSQTKFAIKIFNKLFKSKVKPSLFKQKNEMNEFIGEISNKSSLKLTYNQVQNLSYDEIKSQLSDNFILKPVNASASLLNFRIISESDFDKVKLKIKKKFKYILEKYIEGKLYATDFFFDGENIFLLCYSREITFAEFIDKFSKKHRAKYQDIYNEFRHFLPVRYTFDFKRLTPLELDFYKQIEKRLASINYHGFIHLEYKLNKKTKEIGFIEWGARMGGKRSFFVNQMHNITCHNLPYNILHKKDFSKFKQAKGMYLLKNRNIDRNFIGIKTTVTKKISLIDLLNKAGNYLKISYKDHLKTFFYDNWKIKFNEITFVVNPSKNNYFYPYNVRSDTTFSYYLEMDETNYKKFLKNKNKIIEHLVFHDYNFKND